MRREGRGGRPRVVMIPEKQETGTNARVRERGRECVIVYEKVGRSVGKVGW